ncbi:hypothetical protein [Candidatus Methylacidiphilum infernorum]|uniref:Uncharacterized protein n=1 Tax=Methylacidiphilum infernorum (isolate V4) TaxID=481448 RepID=B3DZN3_METI4|nr:hypothetical protein [Candidatus Methylacidiphilum infernorum]ACD84218.1 Hypothetical protein Minf_2164 [Methylacidiphilum infernorum V4]
MEKNEEEVKEYLLRAELYSSAFAHRAKKRKDRRNFILLFLLLCLVLLFLWHRWIYL